MNNWIAFDEEGAVAAAARTKIAVAFQHGDALDIAIASRCPSIVVLKDNHDQLTLLTVHCESESTDIETTGFLGLAERMVQKQPKQKATWHLSKFRKRTAQDETI